MLDEDTEKHKEKIECELVQDSQAVPKANQNRRKSLYLRDGMTHMVWKPTSQERKKGIGLIDVDNKQNLLERQQKLQSRVMATQQVLKDHGEELAGICEEDEEKSVDEPKSKEQRKWQKTIRNVIEDNAKAKKKHSKRNMHFHEIVSRYVATMTTPTYDGAANNTVPGFQQLKDQFLDGGEENDACFSESSIPMHVKDDSDQCVKSDTKVTFAESN